MPEGTDKQAAYYRKPQQRRDAKHMTRETKLSILIGVSFVLIVAILISDHFSTASNIQLGEADTTPSDVESQLAVDSFEMTAPSVIVQDENGRFVPIDQINATNKPAHTERSTLGQLAADLQQEFGMLRDNGLTPAAATDTVPSFQMGEPTTRPPQSETPMRPQTATPDRVHVVSADDTLWGIAARYYGSGTLHADIRKYNALTDGAALTIGMELRIPDRANLADPTPQQTPQNTPTPTPMTAAGHKLYTVQSGDTLSEIAHRELGSVARMYDIQDAHGRSIDPEDFMLRVGMTLRLPAK